LVPQAVEKLSSRLARPDGKLILSVLLLAVVLFFVPSIVFGLIGAGALVTALFLMDWLDRPITRAMNWLNGQEDAWAGRLRAVLEPDRCHLMAALSLAPVLYYLAGEFLPRRLSPALYYRAGLAGGVAVGLLVLMGIQSRRDVRTSTDLSHRFARRTLLISTLALLLGIGCTSIQMTRRMKIPFFAEGMEWNGIWLAAIPAIALWFWHRGYVRRQGEKFRAVTPALNPIATGQPAPLPAPSVVGPPLSPPAPADETGTWRFSGLAALITVGSGFLLWRALDLQNRGWADTGSTALFALMLVAWFLWAKLLLSLVRSGPGGQVPEWTLVYLALMVSLFFCFFMVHFGGPWGLAAALLPVIMIWRETARLLKPHPQVETTEHTESHEKEVSAAK
jgi:hypothetical protein